MVSLMFTDILIRVHLCSYLCKSVDIFFFPQMFTNIIRVNLCSYLCSSVDNSSFQIKPLNLILSTCPPPGWFCQTSSLTQGMDLSFQRWGWKVSG